MKTRCVTRLEEAFANALTADQFYEVTPEHSNGRPYEEQP